MPETSQVHVDVALTHVSVAYKNAAFAAELIAPPVAVRKQSGKYFVYDAQRETLRRSDDRRAPGAEANEVDFALSTDSYYCEDHALEAAIPDEERDNADPAIQPGIDHTEFLMDKIALNQEIELASLILGDASAPGETLSGDGQWSSANSDPVAAVEARKSAILAATQLAPNTLVLPYEVFAKVRLHAKVAERFKYVESAAPGVEGLARLFDVERVIVPRALKNTAAPGQAASASFVWGKNAFLCHVPASPAPKRAAFAYTFVWGQAPGSIGGRIVERWRENRRKADMIRVQKYYDLKVISYGAIYLWKSAVA